jgi:uncharacterized protein (TIGR00725 family)
MLASARRLTVIGGSVCTAQERHLALETGREIARAGAILLCGGRTGVMEAVAEGARSEGGLTVGVLPGSGPADSPPNPFIELPIYTGLGQARNQVLVLSGEAVIGIGGSWGTLTEIGLSIRHGIPVVLLDSWELVPPDGKLEPLLYRAATPLEAVETALHAASEVCSK